MRAQVTTHTETHQRVLRGDLEVGVEVHAVTIKVPCGGHKIEIRMNITDTSYLIERLNTALKEVEDLQDEVHGDV